MYRDYKEFDFEVRPPWASMIFFTLLTTALMLLVVWMATGVAIGGTIPGWRWMPWS
jgi:hypothetical protein